MAKAATKSTGKKNQKELKSTVRQRKKSQKSNTQRYLPFAEIRNDTVLMKNGGVRAVLKVEPLNFNLKSETEQQGIIAGYESFLNTLHFPVQIVIRSTKVNIDSYLELIHAAAGKQDNGLLKDQTNAYADFIQKIVNLADIMQKQFYIVVPLDDTPPKKTSVSRLFGWLQMDDSAARALQRSKRFTNQSSRLKERLDLIESGLNNIGLRTRRLNTLELIQLYYTSYNRHLSQIEKLPKGGDFNTDKMTL